MMFDNGVEGYCWAAATVHNAFPVDEKGVVYAACKFCRFFRNSYAICSLTDERVPFPDKYVGGHCPLRPEEYPPKDNNDKKEKESLRILK